MPNIDNANQFLVLEGNTAGSNGDVRVLGSNTILVMPIGNTANALSGFIELTNGVVQNYGGCNANSTGTTVTLGYPYVVNVFSVGVDSNTVASTVAATSANTTKIVITSNTTANVFCFWQTWGI